jgi:hypothetical protein
MKEIKKIDVMLLAQPWIQCVLYSNKNVENKSVNKKMHGTVAIYSSINKKNERFEDCKTCYGIQHEYNPEITGKILGFVDIVDVIEPETKNIPRKYKKWWQPEYYGYVLENLRILKTPVAVSKKDGVVSWWTLNTKDKKRVIEAMSTTQINQFKEFEIP